MGVIVLGKDDVTRGVSGEADIEREEMDVIGGGIEVDEGVTDGSEIEPTGGGAGAVAVGERLDG